MLVLARIRAIPLISSVWLLLMCATSMAQNARSITITMLDYKTGQRIKASEFQVWPNGILGGDPIWVKADTEGVAQLDVAPAVSVITVSALYGTAKWSYVSCDSVRDHLTHSYSVSSILASGIAAPNYCGKRKAIAKPGEFIFFVRPMTFWEKMRE